MLERIYGELAKLIARDIYDAAKNVPSLLSSLKDSGLTSSGSGLPEGVLREFDESFVRAMDYSSSDGFGKWRDGKSEARFEFRLISGLVDRVKKSDWAKAAIRTAEGKRQVTALGGTNEYNTRVNNVVPHLVAKAIAACDGQFHETGSGSGWRILTPPDNVQVAHRWKTDFEPYDLFYVAKGSERDTASQYRRAKSLLRDRWLRRRKAPSEGPYFD